MPPTHGKKADGTPIPDDMVDAMADEAERGYDVEEIIRRAIGQYLRRPLPRQGANTPVVGVPYPHHDRGDAVRTLAKQASWG